MKRLDTIRTVTLTALALAAIAAAPALAQNTWAAGQAHGLSTEIFTVGIDTAVPPTPEIFVGPTSDAYLADDSVNGIAFEGFVANGLFDVDTMFLGSPSTATQSTAVVDGFGINIARKLGSVLRVDARTIASSASTGGTCFHALEADTSTTLQGLSVSVFGFPVSIPLRIDPNTVVALPAIPGLVEGSLILHEQEILGDGFEDIGAVVNGLHLVVEVAGILGVLETDLIIAQSSTYLACEGIE